MQVLVSYSYFEKDEGQMQNFEYFILTAMGTHGERNRLPVATDFSIVVNGDSCSPCATLIPHVSVLDISFPGLSAAWGGPHITVLHRIDNFGMDIAAHNVRAQTPLCPTSQIIFKAYANIFAVTDSAVTRADPQHTAFFSRR